MLRKLGKSNQIAIPKEIVKSLHLEADDYLDVYVQNNRIILEPKIVIPRDQAYFYTAEWQKDELHAEKDIESGDVTDTENMDELFSEMDK
ncbi:MAG: AbrB/MazE/SpoVT family DNA-binding domain-containing protein [Fidelibacterota bacterium]